MSYEADEESKEYYKMYTHKNVGAKGIIEYFREADLSEHDERIRIEERTKVLNDFVKWLYEKKGWLRELNTFEYWAIDFFHKEKMLVDEFLNKFDEE